MIKEIKLKADDISCTGCIEDMEIILRDQAGILEAKVNYADDIIDINMTQRTFSSHWRGITGCIPRGISAFR